MANLIIPSVYGSMAREKMLGRIKVAQLATALNLPDFKQVGETVVFPKFKRVSDAEDVKKGTGITVEELGQDSSTAKVMHKGKAIRVYDYDDKTAMGNFIEEANTQHAQLFAKVMDKELIKEALKTPLKTAVAVDKKITADELNAGLALFGDEQDSEDFAGIVVHSLLISSLLNMTEFVDASKTYNQNGNGIQRNGLLGFYRNIPVFVSDTAMDNNECATLIIKKNSLAYMMKKDFDIEEEREAKLKATDLVADMMFAVKQTDDVGVVVLRKTIA
ncbi:hypothetical protein VT91_11450 [Clostridium sporogenes]|uniref:hypothetical protein n=1 Tax=Clostridium botulinum TaxID=1491 RepID=UPI0007177C99|nr:hypothetical protein [Clostridium botulinum]KRU30705.1 hypothetical protein WG71_09490 [Clostridium sporogenes]KRU31531.1 hypothetical protein VT28_12140 [Clostridium sporogenes]KRU33210.1 hypothetical protein VT91_11450 [Clostridium sporogenes]KRU38923.1 hypothetical protein VT95_31130 [Clostridium sporogenes]MBZ1330758.1 hypothetical protein [Clostridium botulinum]